MASVLRHEDIYLKGFRIRLENYLNLMKHAKADIS